MERLAVMTVAPDIRVTSELLASGFQRQHDGWFYPGDSEQSLVRILVDRRHYRLQRRRKLTSDWLTIVACPVADFDADAFRSWRSAWPLLAD